MINMLERFLNKFIHIRLREWHHGYTGLLLLAIGILVFTFNFIIIGVILISIGTWLLLDDFGQHRLQKIFILPDYHSYGHYVGKPFYILRRYLVKKYNWQWLMKL